MSYLEIAKMIDHSILQPNATIEEFKQGIALAIQFECASVCIAPHYLAETARQLQGTGIYACTVIGFPHGTPTLESKLYESEQALHHGAQELDIVVNIGRVKSRDWGYVEDEIVSLATLTHRHEAKIKVIFENAYLSDSEKVRLCEICGEAEVDWVKTSTGYAATGATLEDVQLMRKNSPAKVQVKAAGGIRDIETLLKFRELGATRIGTSRTAELLNAWRMKEGLEVFEARPIESVY